MIVSHEHRFIFVKTRKTAGTSVEIALSRHCGPDDIIAAISPEDEELRRQLGGRGPQHHVVDGREIHSHARAERIRALVGRDVWRRYFRFSIERNPWDAVVSSYHYHYREDPDRAPSFSEFVDQVLPTTRWNSPLYRIGGTIAVTEVCRYEHLDEDLERVRRRVGLPPLELPRAKGGLRDGRPYRDYYTASEIEQVRTLFAATIEAFGYEF